jgi:hypothetical protein
MGLFAAAQGMLAQVEPALQGIGGGDSLDQRRCAEESSWEGWPPDQDLRRLEGAGEAQSEQLQGVRARVIVIQVHGSPDDVAHSQLFAGGEERQAGARLLAGSKRPVGLPEGR